MKWFAIILVMFCTAMGGLIGLSKYSLPQITLPKLAQHNTFGELPIVEMADDGVFAEVNGAEAEYASIWCDELKRGFTCQLKFGMSYDVARRIGKGELLDSCDEARKESEKSFKSCIENVYQVNEMVESYNLSEETAWKLYYDDIDRCWERQRYIPECHGSHKDWLYDNFKGGLR